MLFQVTGNSARWVAAFPRLSLERICWVEAAFASRTPRLLPWGCPSGIECWGRWRHWQGRLVQTLPSLHPKCLEIQIQTGVYQLTSEIPPSNPEAFCVERGHETRAGLMPPCRPGTALGPRLCSGVSRTDRVWGFVLGSRVAHFEPGDSEEMSSVNTSFLLRHVSGNVGRPRS